ncbi:unnamed protein product [Cuscuta epithymum]|uniref:Secreted protein n=1 Tax=Cuscuta epithymum TaxID=186058 RepID=A0AAV0FK30_9ASTE|nr:unnamed protein product [Cuscuta epithymum]
MNVLHSIALLAFLMKSSTCMVPNSPPNLDLTVIVLVSTSFGPITAINGTFCFSAFLISFDKRSPLQSSARIPLAFNLFTVSLQNSSCKQCAHVSIDLSNNVSIHSS